MKRVVILFFILVLVSIVQAGHEEFYADHTCWDECDSSGDDYIPCREECGRQYDALKAAHGTTPSPDTILVEPSSEPSTEKPKSKIYDWDVEFTSKSQTEFVIVGSDKAVVHVESEGSFKIDVNDVGVIGSGNARVDIVLSGTVSGMTCTGSASENIAVSILGAKEDGKVRIYKMDPMPAIKMVGADCGGGFNYDVEVPLTMFGETTLDLEEKVIRRAIRSYVDEWDTEVVTDWTFALQDIGLDQPENEESPIPPPKVGGRIGAAGGVNGRVEILQPDGTWKQVTSGTVVNSNDQVRTGPKGRLQVLLLDQTVFTLGPDTDLVLDEFVYDPNTDAGVMTANIAKGIFRFVTGKIARKKPSNMRIKLPVGTIGIRGTDAIVEYGSASEMAIVYLNEGELLISPDNGGDVILRAGEMLTFWDAGATPATELKTEDWDALSLDLAPTLAQPKGGGLSDESAIMKLGIYLGYALGILLIISPIIVLGLAIYLVVRWRRHKK